MLEVAAIIAFILLLRIRTKWPWIWVVPNAAAFGLGLIMSVDWLSGENSEGLADLHYRILGMAPVFLWIGSIVGYWVYSKTHKSWISNIPIFIGFLLCSGCIWFAAEQISR